MMSIVIGVPCGVIRAPSNGKLVGMGQNSTVESFDGVFEDTLTVKCNHGSKLRVPQHNRYTCDAAGQWVGDAPVCVRKLYKSLLLTPTRVVKIIVQGKHNTCILLFHTVWFSSRSRCCKGG